MTYRSRSQPLSEDTLQRMRDRYLALDALLTQDGFHQDSSGNPHPGSPQINLEYHYTSPGDGRSATIKFKVGTSEVLLMMRSPL